MNEQKTKKTPSIDEWLKNAKADAISAKVGMFLVHNGVVRETPKAKVRLGQDDGTIVESMEFSFDAEKVNRAVEETYELEGIHYVKIWLNEGLLQVGDDIMYVLVGGDIRPHVIDGLQYLVEKVKTECVVEIEKKSSI